jgi:hypothetical protein
MILMAQFRVREFYSWKSIFAENTPFRTGHGCTGHLMYRGEQDPNEVTILLRFPGREQADGFTSDPRLREVMQRAGVISEPRFLRLREEEIVDYVQRKAA